MPETKDVTTVTCVGAGVIGGGWVAHFLARGYQVQAWDPAPDTAERLARLVASAWPAVTELGLADGASPDNVTVLPTLAEAVEGAGFVQESAPEDLAVKRSLLAHIAAVNTRRRRQRRSAGRGQVRAAVDYAVAALEIVDSRISDWDIKFTDTVADNASSGLYVLGTERRTLDQVEPAGVRMEMQVNGHTVSRGGGAACLGDPLAALGWLAAQHGSSANRFAPVRWCFPAHWAPCRPWYRATRPPPRSQFLTQLPGQVDVHTGSGRGILLQLHHRRRGQLAAHDKGACLADLRRERVVQGSPRIDGTDHSAALLVEGTCRVPVGPTRPQGHRES
jgi:hypothetical protein